MTDSCAGEHLHESHVAAERVDVHVVLMHTYSSTKIRSTSMPERSDEM